MYRGLQARAAAQDYTSDIKNAPAIFERDSRPLQGLMESKGFLP